MRLQAGARTLRSEDDIIALLKTTPEEIRFMGSRVRLFFRRKNARYIVIIEIHVRSITIVTFMEEL